jgi:uronate dehydrogenase
MAGLPCYCVLVSIIVITGAAGVIGTMLRPRLARPHRTLRLLDIAPVTPGDREEYVQASTTDLAAMTAACQGADAVIHLAGVPGEVAWEAILELNIHGTYTAFEAARRAGVPRVIFASSNHAVGFTPRSRFPVPDCTFPAPDTYYGVSKVAAEGLAGLYHYRYGLDTICIRILTCFPEPPDRRALSTWLSPDDAGRLFDACLTAPSPGFRVVFGVSANTRGGFVSLDEARALGYEPQDDAEVYAEAILAADPDRDVPDEEYPPLQYLGGRFTFPDLDAPLSLVVAPALRLCGFAALRGCGAPAVTTWPDGCGSCTEPARRATRHLRNARDMCRFTPSVPVCVAVQ